MIVSAPGCFDLDRHAEADMKECVKTFGCPLNESQTAWFKQVLPAWIRRAAAAEKSRKHWQGVAELGMTERLALAEKLKVAASQAADSSRHTIAAMRDKAWAANLRLREELAEALSTRSATAAESFKAADAVLRQQLEQSKAANREMKEALDRALGLRGVWEKEAAAELAKCKKELAGCLRRLDGEDSFITEVRGQREKYWQQVQELEAVVREKCDMVQKLTTMCDDAIASKLAMKEALDKCRWQFEMQKQAAAGVVDRLNHAAKREKELVQALRPFARCVGNGWVERDLASNHHYETALRVLTCPASPDEDAAQAKPEAAPAEHTTKAKVEYNAIGAASRPVRGAAIVADYEYKDDLVAEAVKKEREACAEVAEKSYEAFGCPAKRIADAIRGRK